MKTFPRKLVALALVVVLCAPVPLLVAPRPARAGGFPVFDAFNFVKNSITSVATVAQAASSASLVIDKYVLEPLAFIESGNLVKSITAGVLKFVAGQTNGTGAPQFVQDVRGFQRSVSDTQALAFVNQFNADSNSPFGSSISASLAQNYLQQTSLRGFFAANQCTLSAVSPNENAFLAGDWSQGGTAAWFALTTEPQNNPFLLNFQAQAELSSLVVNATDAQLQELNWGNGFLSWCGASGSSGSGASSDGVQQVAVTGAAGQGYVSPQAGQTCMQSDGKPGIIKTPGSVISSELNQALGLNWQKVTSFGNEVGPEINSIMGSIATVMNTINFASNLLGGGSGSGGLAGVAAPSSSGAQSALAQYANQSGYLGATPSSVNQNTVSQSQLANFENQVNTYQSDWNTIGNAAQAASTALGQLSSGCAAAANLAQGALQSEVDPVLAHVAQAATTVSNANSMIAKIQAEQGSTVAGASGALTADLLALQNMPPSTADVANAEQASTVLALATSTPPGSLTVSGGSTIDQMNLITRNANTLLSACIAPSFGG